MFNWCVDLAEYLSSAKLIIGSILIFVFIFALSACVIVGLAYIYNPLPSHKKKFLFAGLVFTFVLDIIFFVLSLYDKVLIVPILILIAVFVLLEYLMLMKLAEKKSVLANALIEQALINSVLYFIGSYYLTSFYILLFCMNGR